MVTCTLLAVGAMVGATVTPVPSTVKDLDVGPQLVDAPPEMPYPSMLQLTSPSQVPPQAKGWYVPGGTHSEAEAA